MMLSTVDRAAIRGNVTTVRTVSTGPTRGIQGRAGTILRAPTAPVVTATAALRGAASIATAMEDVEAFHGRKGHW